MCVCIVVSVLHSKSCVALNTNVEGESKNGRLKLRPVHNIRASRGSDGERKKEKRRVFRFVSQFSNGMLFDECSQFFAAKKNKTTQDTEVKVFQTGFTFFMPLLCQTPKIELIFIECIHKSERKARERERKSKMVESRGETKFKLYKINGSRK